MKAKVYEDKCIGCGQCEAICDEVFQIKDDGFAHVIVDEIKEDLLESAEMAKESCPTEAIVMAENFEEEQKNG